MHNKYNIIRDLALLSMLGDLLAWALPVPSMVWRVMLVLLSLSAFFFIPHEKTVFEKVTVYFAFFNLLYFFISVIWINPLVPQIGSILYALLSLSLFAALAEKGVLTDRFLGGAVLLLAIGCVLFFYQQGKIILEKKTHAEEYAFTNNGAYNFVYLLPLLFLLRSRWQKWLVFVVCMIFLILGAKRGAILAAVIPMLSFVGYELKNGRRSFLKSVLVVIATAAVSVLAYRMYMANEYLISRVQDTLAGDSSGRDKIYLDAWNIWSQAENPLNLLLGFGFDGTLTTSMHFRAHNDWLEILVDYGLLGVLFYAVLFVAFIRQIAVTREKKYRLVLFSGFTVWGLQSLYSMGFTSAHLAIMMMGLGTAIGRSKAETEESGMLPQTVLREMPWDGLHSLADLDLESVRAFMERLKSRGADVPESPEDFLSGEGLCNADGQLTNGTFLLFGKAEVSEAAVVLKRYAAADSMEAEYAECCAANLVRQLEEVTAFVPEADYPEGVLREIIINMLAHRDYTSMHNASVKVYPDRVECFNPGNLGRRIDNRPRNKQLAGLFCSQGSMEGKGEGIRRVKTLCREEGLPDPQWKPVSDGVRVTVWKSSGNVSDLQLSRQEQQLLHALDGIQSMQEIMLQLGLDKQSEFRKDYLLPALSKGLVAQAQSEQSRTTVQNYFLTVKGRKWLEENDKNNRL